MTVTGRGTHGSTPHLGVDPIPALAEMVTATHQMVTRRHNIFDPVVVTVGMIEAGSAANVIPESGSFRATIRAFSREARRQVLEEFPRLVEGIATAHDVEADFHLIEQYPVTINDPEQTRFAAETITEMFGADRFLLWDNPLAGAEDFSRILEQAPGCFIGLAATPEDLDPATAPFNHSPLARFDDSVVPDGAALLSELARRHLVLE